MAGYAISDVRMVLAEREWDNWDELLLWLERLDGDAQTGMSDRDRLDLLVDLRQLRDGGTPLTDDVKELYQQLADVRTTGVTPDADARPAED
jgi:hypothetical protein